MMQVELDQLDLQDPLVVQVEQDQLDLLDPQDLHQLLLDLQVQLDPQVPQDLQVLV